MYGQYKEDLEAYAKAEARRLKALQKLRKKEETIRKKELKTYRSAWQRRLAGTNNFFAIFFLSLFCVFCFLVTLYILEIFVFKGNYFHIMI